MDGVIYSCGIEALVNAKQFVDTMRMYGVQAVYDVRNASELRKKQYVSKQEVRELSPFSKINYFDAANGFSMDTTERKLLHSKGYVDIEKLVASLSFRTLLSQVEEKARNGKTVCLLGYYENPSKCHRFFIASELLKEGFDVQHIGPGAPKLHSILEEELVDATFPELDQIAMFDIPPIPFDVKLQKTMKVLSKDIGENWLKEAKK